MRKRVPAWMLAMALFALAAGCGSDMGTDPQLAEVAGRYTLRTINGSVLPARVTNQWVLELTLQLTDEGRMILVGFDLPLNGAPPSSAPSPGFAQDVRGGGSFTRVGNTISFTAAPNSVYFELGTAPFENNDTLVVTSNAGTLTQQRWYEYMYVRDDF